MEKKPIQRNAIIALAHYKEESALPTLLDLLIKDPRPVIRGTSAWAIGKISKSEKEEKALEDAKKNEQDENVLNEIEKGLSFIREKK